ncbi:MAG: hypothetical protein V2I63_04710 [Pseudomonadales bacterium]|jgi:hypothetical protein|nr:hypothetical protein [Pseudomonadales bacterium]
MSGSGFTGDARAALRDAVVREARQPPQAEVQILVDALRTRFGPRFVAALYYGSCRKQAVPEGLVDLHLIVDDARAALGPVAGRLCAWLPPNVYYLEVDGPSGRVRCKYAVLSQARFGRLCTRRAFHSYFWARYAQPLSLLGVADPALLRSLEEHLVDAQVTFFSQVLPLCDGATTPAELWEAGLALCYRAELRPEGGGRGRTLIAAAEDFFEATGAAALAVRPSVLGHADPALARLAWRLRIAWGKAISLARLLKALYTFDGGLDYAAWKLERHTGHAIEVPERVRRRPLLHLGPFIYRLWREGVLR